MTLATYVHGEEKFAVLLKLILLVELLKDLCHRTAATGQEALSKKYCPGQTPNNGALAVPVRHCPVDSQKPQ